VTKNNYIVFDKEGLDEVKLKTTHTIDIKEFIEYNELDPIFIDDSYYVSTDSKKGNKKPLCAIGKNIKRQ
jgi:DNA end-binding protein Ku